MTINRQVPSVALCKLCLLALWAGHVNGFSSPRFVGYDFSTPRITSAAAVEDNVVATAVALQMVTEPGADDQEEDKKKSDNPYNDPSYPELEFVDYSDPNYVVDQGVSDDFFDPSAYQRSEEDDDTEQQIEEMREERRRRNDEFQFETYFKDSWMEGKEFLGDWTIYRTSTFVDGAEDDPSGFPRFLKPASPVLVSSRAFKVDVESTSEFKVDSTRICHEEVAVSIPGEEDTSDEHAAEKDVLEFKCYPTQLKSFDFRGQQGNMRVGSAYSVCTATPLEGSSEEYWTGPFDEMRTEIGIFNQGIRMRLKFDYRVTPEDRDQSFPPLKLKTMTVCREAVGIVPDKENLPSLFGPPGAAGGLYDPPPVGSDQQAGQYMMLDLDGGATALFPFVMDQHPAAFNGNGWVTSLDWTPSSIRYQVDRKVHSGKGLLGLRTLELSEVQSADANQWRPRDGGQDMRQ